MKKNNTIKTSFPYMILLVIILGTFVFFNLNKYRYLPVFAKKSCELFKFALYKQMNVIYSVRQLLIFWRIKCLSVPLLHKLPALRPRLSAWLQPCFRPWRFLPFSIFCLSVRKLSGQSNIMPWFPPLKEGIKSLPAAVFWQRLQMRRIRNFWPSKLPTASKSKLTARPFAACCSLRPLPSMTTKLLQKQNLRQKNKRP